MINVNTLTVSDITAMINSEDGVIRKYGVIAARKVYEKYPEIIKESVNYEDLDVQDFSKTEVQVEVEMAQLRNRIRESIKTLAFHENQSAARRQRFSYTYGTGALRKSELPFLK